MVRPRPRVTKPRIGSPGTGRQQRAKRSTTSPRPSITTPLPVPRLAAVGGAGAALPGTWRLGQGIGRGHFLRDQQKQQIAHAQLAATDGDLRLGEVAQAQGAAQLVQLAALFQAVQVQAETLELALAEFVPEQAAGLALGLANGVADLAFGAVGDGEFQPLFVRRLRFVGLDVR